MYASKHGLKDAVEVLLTAGLDVNQTDKVRMCLPYKFLSFGLLFQDTIAFDFPHFMLFLFYTAFREATRPYTMPANRSI